MNALFTELSTLNASTAQQLAVLLLGHALAALLDDRTHNGFPRFIDRCTYFPARSPTVSFAMHTRPKCTSARAGLLLVLKGSDLH
ncbi:Hypothetical protein CpCap5W_0285 [Corynebacterium pseudotuberculosis]|nr:hypothetical protein CPTA_00798 [Corynebacterium pseudotuberculosis]AIG08790.1 hypothetical protein CPTB_00734 [Corynebacterium pseudotuberculosis]AIG10684.1 hypothetical protein CPTC_00396 [Corynebacterium pseudotuberculosis]AQL50387.1 hypothetical protein CpPA04_0270 [Corynebacterium pseudotuberculosis]ATB61187.1 Thioredoxin [Corynebacterium pseudotuberculosis]